MSDENKPKRWRAIFKNALTWSVGWGVLGTAWASLHRLNDNIPFWQAILDGIGMGIRIGIVGGITGAAFAAFISMAYRGKRLSEISWVKFGLGGLILGGLFVPTFLETMSLITGGGWVPLHLVTDDITFSALFGGITAAGTMLLAQHDEAKNPVTVQELLDKMEQQALGPGDPGFVSSQRSRAAEQRR